MTHMSINQAMEFYPRPVVHPEVAAADRDLLAASLTAAEAVRQLEHPPNRLLVVKGWGAALMWGAAAGLVFGAGQVVRVLIEQLRSWPAFQDLPSPAATTHIMTALSFGVAVTGVVCALMVRKKDAKALRVIRAYRGRYFTAVDFDEPAARLLARLQYALEMVSTSKVHLSGLLDRESNNLVLRSEEWEIAAALRIHTDLRSVQRDAAQTVDERRAADILAGQRHMLGLAVRAVTDRVEAMEHYAEQVRAADAVYAEVDTLRHLSTHEERYQDLLARTAADELASAHVRDLTDKARQLTAELEADLITEESRTSPPARPQC